MTAKVIDGKAIAQTIQQKIAEQVQERLAAQKPAPSLVVILVGDHPASMSYVKHKQAACTQVGILSHCHRLPMNSSLEQVSKLIDSCNEDPSIHGILLQLPLPDHIPSDQLLERIHPSKDVDGFHPYNMGLLALRMPKLRPCTPYGIMTLLDSTGCALTSLHAVVVGASNIVGRPMALELLLAKCTVTICHRFTKNLAKHVQQADILIAATGKIGIINSEWIKPGAIVIDVGIHRLPSGKITGDINFQPALERAGWITPVPGGVGPMTIATLLQNTLTASEMG